MIDFSRIRALTFDCYGTMIDWESGIFSVLRTLTAAHGRSIADAQLLEMYGELEAEAESGEYQSYREVLRSVVRGIGTRLKFEATEQEMNSLPESMARWEPFSDTVEALKKLATRYELAVLSNVDDDLFAGTRPKLKTDFKVVVTAQQAGCYKPCLQIFRMGLQRLGASAEEVLHVGQSIYHDVVPAQSLGITTVWVNRPSPRANVVAVRPASGKPDFEVPSLESLAKLAV